MELSPRSELPKLESKIIGSFTVICGVLVFVSSGLQINHNLWGQVAVFAVLSFLSLLIPTRLPQGADFSVAFILDLVIIAIFGTPLAVVTRFAVTLGAGFFSILFGRQDSLFRIAKAAGEAVLVVGLAGTVYQLAGTQVLAFGAAAVFYFIVSTFLAAFDGVFTSRESMVTGWISVMQSIYLYFFVLSPLAYLLTFLIRNAATQWKFFGVLLFFVPVMLVSHAFRLFINIKQSYLNTVKTMVRAIEAKDPYMRGHSEHVAELTLAVAREIGMPERELRKLEYVALLHDAGKIGVSEEILNKPSTLSMKEYNEVKKHSALGAEIIDKIKFLSSKSDIVLYHHERYDGTGYPAGLTGQNIPLESRILAIADAYDAMITNRPFRRAKTSLQALEEMQQLVGTQFDPVLMETFIAVLKKRGEI
ncbi:MAG: HD-GYP domain-containing protein [Firmicutes bacterium]|nr:HD-GYP domain-containing protein [Bacillota bacterium]